MNGDPGGRPIAPIFDPMPPLTVLFDGECPFCRWTAGKLRRWDRERNLRLRPFQSVRQQAVLADLVEGRPLGHSLHVVDGAGRIANGGDGFLAIAALLPGGRPAAELVAAVPPSRIAVAAVYRVIERTRGPLASLLGLDGPRLLERNPAFGLPPD